MRIYENGIYRNMTQEEVEECNKNNIELPQEPTLEERMTELERINREQSKLIQELTSLMKVNLTKEG